jgi:hypothetical protein
MIGFNVDAARIRYSAEDDDELVRIAYVDSDNFVPEAITLAKEELARRGVYQENDERVNLSKQRLQKQAENKKRLANEPLSLPLKLICFLLADVVAIIIALTKSQSGKKRASREAWKFIAYGWLFRIALSVFVAWFRHSSVVL